MNLGISVQVNHFEHLLRIELYRIRLHRAYCQIIKGQSNRLKYIRDIYENFFDGPVRTPCTTQITNTIKKYLSKDEQIEFLINGFGFLTSDHIRIQIFATDTIFTFKRHL